MPLPFFMSNNLLLSFTYTHTSAFLSLGYGPQGASRAVVVMVTVRKRSAAVNQGCSPSPGLMGLLTAHANDNVSTRSKWVDRHALSLSHVFYLILFLCLLISYTHLKKSLSQ